MTETKTSVMKETYTGEQIEMNLPSLEDKDLLFYDIEVFPHNAFVVFKDIDGKLKRCFHNNFLGLREFIKGKTLVGFNNYWYDDKIITDMIQLRTPEQIKTLNDNIINNPNFKKTIDNSILSLDVFQQISVAKSGLKKIEGNMGKMILESSVDFNIPRPLTDREFQEAFEYCCYDVDMVIEIWKQRKKSYFEPKMKLLERLGNDRAYKWNTTTISANLLLKKPLVKWATIRVDEELLDIVPPDVKDMWLQVNSASGNPSKKSITIKEFGNDIQFGFGGIHSTRSQGKRFENIILSDIGLR